MPGSEPNPYRVGAGKRYAWRCWWESCPLCLSMEGKVFTWDMWLAAGIMPGIHAYCDCTLKQVPDDTPLSDPAMFGFPLDMILDEKGRWGIKDPSYKQFASNFLDIILANTPPGGTIKDAFARMNTLDSGRSGLLFPGASQHSTIFDHALSVWSRYFDWGGTWRTIATLNHYSSLSGYGSQESLTPRPKPLRSWIPTFSHNRYHTYLFGE